MDALFSKSITKAAWAQVRRKPLPLDPIADDDLDLEKEKAATYEVRPVENERHDKP